MVENAQITLIRVLILSAQDHYAELALLALSQGDAEIQYRLLQTESQFAQALAEAQWDVVLADDSIVGFTPFDALHYLREAGFELPLIIISEVSDEARIVEAMRAGAQDFVLQGKSARLLSAVERAVSEAKHRIERQSVANRYREAQQQLQLLLDTSRMSVVVWDVPSEMLTYQHNFETLFGEPYQLQDSQPSSLLARLHNEDRARLEANCFAELLGQSKFVYEYRVIWPDGSTQWLRAQGKVLRDERQKLSHVIAVVQNVTDQKRSEQFENERKYLAMQLEKERGIAKLHRRFMIMAAHEFRTPLTVISTANELLCEYYDQMSPEKHKEYLYEIRTRVRALRDMLTEIESVTRDEYISMDFSPHPTDVAALCKRVIDEVQEGLRAGIALTFRNKLHRPMAAIDGRLVGHILMQLLQNAVKFSRGDSEVILEARDDVEGQIAFAVSDHGIGIFPEDLPHIYDLFMRGSNVGAVAGRGMGLKIVLDCVHAHHGEIDVQSVVNKGTQFTVTLPTKQPE